MASTTASRLRFSDFVDLMLARLYDLEREYGDRYFDLNAINSELAEPVPQHWIFDAGKVLESRGTANCIFAFGGVCRGRLTGEGRLFVEQSQNAESGIIKEYYASPQNFVVVSGSGNQVVVGTGGVRDVKMTVEQQRSPAFEILAQIEEQLKQDRTLSEERRRDLLQDTEAVRGQLRKVEPNRAALAAILEPMSQVASIGGFVASLIQLLNP